MNLVNLFTREEDIAGLEVSDSYLRLAILEIVKTKNKTSTEIKALAEVELPEGAVVDGALKDKDLFVKALADLLSKTPAKERYVIISLPADNVYSKIFYFPKSVQGQKLEETMQLTVGFQLPVTPDDVYLDWEKIEPSEQNEIFLATIPKVIVDGYIQALESAGLKTIAVESHPMSFGRIADVPKKETLLITAEGKSSTAVFIIKDLSLLFSRILPKSHFNEETTEEELRKIKDYYESKAGKIDRTASLNDLVMPGKFSNDPKFGGQPGKWLISAGAALRGLLPRSEDNLVSLMPVGTEEAYEYQKAITFSELMSNVVTGIAIVFGGAYLGALLLALNIQQNFSKQVNLLSSLPLPAGSSELEVRAAEFNNLVSVGKNILNTLPRWSPVLESLRTALTPGITISGVTLAGGGGPFTLTGVAQNRLSLNAFKKSLEESSPFTDVKLPLTNLEQKENISFSISFTLRDPNLLTN